MGSPAIEGFAMLALRPWIGSCGATMARLSGHLDRDLPARDERRVRRHLHRCPRCRAVYDSLARAVDQVRLAGRRELEQPAPSLAAAVSERIRHERG